MGCECKAETKLLQKFFFLLWNFLWKTSAWHNPAREGDSIGYSTICFHKLKTRLLDKHDKIMTMIMHKNIILSRTHLWPVGQSVPVCYVLLLWQQTRRTTLWPICDEGFLRKAFSWAIWSSTEGNNKEWQQVITWERTLQKQRTVSPLHILSFFRFDPNTFALKRDDFWLKIMSTSDCRMIHDIFTDILVQKN